MAPSGDSIPHTIHSSDGTQALIGPRGINLGCIIGCTPVPLRLCEPRLCHSTLEVAPFQMFHQYGLATQCEA